MDFHVKFNGENIMEIKDWLEKNDLSNKLTLSQIGNESLLSLDDYGIIIYKGEKLIKTKDGRVESYKKGNSVFSDSHVETWEESRNMFLILGGIVSFIALVINFFSDINILWWPPVVVGMILALISHLFKNSAVSINLWREKIEEIQKRNAQQRYGKR